MLFNHKSLLNILLAPILFIGHSTFADEINNNPPQSFTTAIESIDTKTLYEGLRYGYFFNTWEPACFYYSSSDCMPKLLEKTGVTRSLTRGEVEPYINQINKAIESATIWYDAKADPIPLSEDWYYQFYLITYTLLNKSLVHFVDQQPQQAIDQLTLIHSVINLYEQDEINSSETVNLHFISLRQLYTQYLDIMLNHGFLQPYLQQKDVANLFNFNENIVRQQYIRKQMHQISNESQESLEPLPNIESITTIDSLDDEELFMALMRMVAYNKNHFISLHPTLSKQIQSYTPKCETFHELDDAAIVASQDQEFFVTYFDTCLADNSPLRTASINDIIHYLKQHYLIIEGTESYQQAMQQLLSTDANNIMSLGYQLYETQCQESTTANKFCIRLMDTLSKTVLLDEVLAYQYLVHLKYQVLAHKIQPDSMDTLLSQPQYFIQNAKPIKKIVWNAESQSLLTKITAVPDKQSIPVMNTDDRFFSVKVLFDPTESKK